MDREKQVQRQLDAANAKCAQLQCAALEARAAGAESGQKLTCVGGGLIKFDPAAQSIRGEAAAVGRYR